MLLNLTRNMDYDKFNFKILSLSSIDTDQEIVSKFNHYCNSEVIYFDKVIDKEQFFLEFRDTVDIFHSHGFSADRFVFGLNGDFKKITTLHSTIFKDYQVYGRVKGFLGSIMHLCMLNRKRFDKVIGCSESVYNGLKKYLRNVDFTYINNGVEQSQYYPITQEDKLKLRINLGLPIDKRIFCFSGNLIRRKRVPELISLFLSLKLPNSILIIVGDGDELDRCKTLSNKSIKLIGRVKNVKEYYQSSDFIVSNSSAEGYPMSILEGVSCGCYALLSDIPSHREFLNLNPKAGTLLTDISDDILNKTSEFSSYELSAKKMAEEYSSIYLLSLDKG
ncbi:MULTISPECIES: glycosyltransferase family 4 protein [unclassified Lonepinella]|uniref:glycosyltransferase family 4 protein n=1 Tax=unclassified Lonepinella TaxID=2642006 RepID=UPI0036DABD5C